MKKIIVKVKKMREREMIQKHLLYENLMHCKKRKFLIFISLFFRDIYNAINEKIKDIRAQKSYLLLFSSFQ